MGRLSTSRFQHANFFSLLLALILLSSALSAQPFAKVYPDHEVHDYLALARWNGDTVFAAGNNSGFMRSIDAGLTWMPVFPARIGYDFTRMGANASGIYLLPSPTLATESEFLDSTRMFIFRYDPRKKDLERIDVPCPVPHRRKSDAFYVSISVVVEGVFLVQSALPATLDDMSTYREMSLLYRENNGAAWSSIQLPDSISVQRPTAYFRDARRGFLVCESRGPGANSIFATSDGGAHWTRSVGAGTYVRPLGRTVDRPAQWVDDTTFIIASDKYVLRKTTDLGQHWVEFPTVPTPSISSFFFQPNGFGIVSGEYLDICRTTDYGATWQNIHTQYGYPVPLSMQTLVLDSLTSISAGYNGNIFRTADAGVTWDVPLMNAMIYYPFFFTTDDRGLGLRASTFENAPLEYCGTTDGGSTWTTEFSQEGMNGTYISPVDEQQLWAVNVHPYFRDELVYLSVDGGYKWEVVCRSTMFDSAGVRVPSNLYGVFACGKDSFMVYTDHGMLRTMDRGKSWDLQPQILSIPVGRLDIHVALYSNTHPYQWFISRRHMIRSSDFGKTWVAVDSLPVRPDPLWSVIQANVMNGMQVTLYWEDTDFMDKFTTTTDGGATWSRYENAVSRTGGLQKINMFSGGVGYGLKGRYTMHQSEYVLNKTNDYWHTCTPIFSFSQSYRGTSPFSMYFRSVSNGWVANGPELWRTTNGGVNWVKTEAPAPREVRLASVHPNPLRSGADVVIDFLVSGGAPRAVEIVIFDCFGRKMHEEFTAAMPGRRVFRWNTRNATPGVYFVRLTAGDRSEMGKIIVQ